MQTTHAPRRFPFDKCPPPKRWIVALLLPPDLEETFYDPELAIDLDTLKYGRARYFNRADVFLRLMLVAICCAVPVLDYVSRVVASGFDPGTYTFTLLHLVLSVAVVAVQIEEAPKTLYFTRRHRFSKDWSQPDSATSEMLLFVALVIGFMDLADSNAGRLLERNVVPILLWTSAIVALKASEGVRKLQDTLVRAAFSSPPPGSPATDEIHVLGTEPVVPATLLSWTGSPAQRGEKLTMVAVPDQGGSHKYQIRLRSGVCVCFHSRYHATFSKSPNPSFLGYHYDNGELLYKLLNRRRIRPVGPAPALERGRQNHPGGGPRYRSLAEAPAAPEWMAQLDLQPWSSGLTKNMQCPYSLCDFEQSEVVAVFPCGHAAAWSNFRLHVSRSTDAVVCPFCRGPMCAPSGDRQASEESDTSE